MLCFWVVIISLRIYVSSGTFVPLSSISTDRTFVKERYCDPCISSGSRWLKA